jgi:hypothetical protein
MNWTAKFIITAILGVMGTIIAQAQTGGNYTITQSVIGRAAARVQAVREVFIQLKAPSDKRLPEQLQAI